MADALHADLCTVKRTSSSEHRSTHHTAQEINIESERSGRLINGCRIKIEGLIKKINSGNTTKNRSNAQGRKKCCTSKFYSLIVHFDLLNLIHTDQCTSSYKDVLVF
jgi:hypothetical protein